MPQFKSVDCPFCQDLQKGRGRVEVVILNEGFPNAHTVCWLTEEGFTIARHHIGEFPEALFLPNQSIVKLRELLEGGTMTEKEVKRVAKEGGAEP